MLTTVMDFLILIGLLFGFAGFIIASVLWCFIKLIIEWDKRRG